MHLETPSLHQPLPMTQKLNQRKRFGNKKKRKKKKGKKGNLQAILGTREQKTDPQEG